MDTEEIIINLKILHKLEKNQKLITRGSYLNVESPSLIPEFLRSDLAKYIVLGAMLGLLFVGVYFGYNQYRHNQNLKTMQPCFDLYTNGQQQLNNSNVICCGYCLIKKKTPQHSYIGNSCFCKGVEKAEGVFRV
jgi:hypothetical protein